MYASNFCGSEDSFAFVADHAVTGATVTFFGEVVDGSITLGYSHAILKEKGDAPNGTENPDGTVTVGGVEGTIIQEPGTSIDFPEGTVVIGTDFSVDDDIAVIEAVEGSEIFTYDDIQTLDDFREILESYPDGSIPGLAVVGHGANGGVQLPGKGDDIDGETLTNGEHDDLIELIDEKLEEDATIYILGCSQFDEGDARYIQDLADATDRAVIANEGDVGFGIDEGWWWWEADEYIFTCDGHWVEVTPSGSEAPNSDSP